MATSQSKEWVSVQSEMVKSSQIKKVSVVVPNYNYGRYIKKRIGTILDQTYPIYELIILDDASTDGSAETIKSMVLDLKLKNPEMRIKFVPNGENSGKAMAAWKKGFELANGDYVWIAEADDLCARDFLAEVMRGFDDPEVVMAYTESAIINSWGLVVAPNFRWSRDKEKIGHYKRGYVKDGKDEIREIMAIRCTVPNVSAVVFRKDKKFLKYLNESLRFTQVGDWYFYVKVLEHGKISYNRKSLNKFRVHGDSKTGKSKKEGRHYEEILEMHEMFKREYNLPKETVFRMEKELKRVEKRVAG